MTHRTRSIARRTPRWCNWKGGKRISLKGFFWAEVIEEILATHVRPSFSKRAALSTVTVGMVVV